MNFQQYFSQYMLFLTELLSAASHIKGVYYSDLLAQLVEDNPSEWEATADSLMEAKGFTPNLLRAKAA